MPICRKKACSQCRQAKTRCNLGFPRCSRCTQRQLDCDYGGHPGGHPLWTRRSAPRADVQLQSTRPPSPTVSEILGGNSLKADSGYLGNELRRADGVTSPPSSQQTPCPEPASRFHLTLPPDITVLTAAPRTSLRNPETLDYDLLGRNFATCLPGPGQLDLPANMSLASPAGFFDMPLFENGLDPLTPRLESSSRANMCTRGTSPQTLVSENSSRILSIRRAGTPNGFLVTNIILGQIGSYPKRMIEGQILPPFIHSNCALDDTLSYSCSSNSCHQCLSPTLSICASLVRMFYTKTPSNSSFVWKTVYAERARLHREYGLYDHKELLEALQAMCIYIIIQSHDGESVEADDAKAMILTIGALDGQIMKIGWLTRSLWLQKIASKLHEESNYDACFDGHESTVSRAHWVFYESTRRTMALLHIVQIVLEVIIGERGLNTDRCQGFVSTPLPSTRDLWEVEATSEWTRRYRETLRRRKSSQVLNIAKLKLVQNVPIGRAQRDAMDDIHGDVVNWCQSLDQYGMVVWMAADLFDMNGDA